MGFELMDREPDLVHLPVVPVAHFVEVDEAHVVGINIAHLLPMHLNRPTNVVLRLELVSTRRVLTLNAICLVCKDDFTGLLVTHFTHKKVEESVALVIESDFLAVFEGDLFETLGIKGG